MYLANVHKWGFALLIFSLSISSFVFAKPVVTLATEPKVPYIGNNLPNNGYVYQIVEAALQHAGYDLAIEYYPLARARKLGIEGNIDGYITIYDLDKSTDNIALSDPLPGGQMGLLKRTDSFQNQEINLSTLKSLGSLKNSRFGLVRGAVAEQISPNINSSNIQWVVNDLQNIDMLVAERIDFALIDKYTTGDLLVSKRPHLIDQLEYIYPPLKELDFHVGFAKKKDPDGKLLTAFNKGLTTIRANGTMNAILAKHGFFANATQTLPSTKSTQLVIGTVNNADMLHIKELSTEFERLYPDVEIVFSVLDESTLRARILTDVVLSDGRFDVITLGAFETPILAEMELLEPIHGLSEDYQLNDLLPVVKQALSHKKQLYALPINAESSVLYYRKDLFKDHNIDFDAPISYEQVAQIAAKLHQPEEGLNGICLRTKPGWGESLALISTMVNTFGGRWFDKNWRPQFLTKEWKQAIEMYVRLVQQFTAEEFLNNGFNENLQLFIDGKCAMWVDATVAANSLFDPSISLVSEHVALTHAPIGRFANGSQWLWSWSLAIPRSSKQKQAASDFIQWATSKQTIQLIAERYSPLAIPSGTRYSTYKNEKYLQQAPFADSVLASLNLAQFNYPSSAQKPYDGIQYVAIKEFPAIGDIVARLIEKVVLNELSVDEALVQAQHMVDRQMRASGYY